MKNVTSAASNSSRSPATTSPEWAKTYMGAVAKALGDAYAEPAKDVEGYIAYVKGQKKDLPRPAAHRRRRPLPRLLM